MFINNRMISLCMIKFIRNNIERKARFGLEKIARKTKPIFQTSEGRDEVVKSILYSEFPLVLSEYVFEIKERKFVSVVYYPDEIFCHTYTMTF